jgi:hypothetical protein
MLLVLFLALSFIDEQIATSTIPTTSPERRGDVQLAAQRRSTKKKEVPGGVGGGSISVR